MSAKRVPEFTEFAKLCVRIAVRTVPAVVLVGALVGLEYITLYFMRSIVDPSEVGFLDRIFKLSIVASAVILIIFILSDSAVEVTRTLGKHEPRDEEHSFQGGNHA